MSEKLSQENPSPQSATERVNNQIDQYLTDKSLHLVVGGPQGGDVQYHAIPGGSVGHNIERGVGDQVISTNRHLSVAGEVNGEHLVSEVKNNTEYGRNHARTSKNESSYVTNTRKGSSYASALRKTPEGETYAHVFKDEEKVKKASELIIRLASKRAAKVIETKQNKRSA